MLFFGNIVTYSIAEGRDNEGSGHRVDKRETIQHLTEIKLGLSMRRFTCILFKVPESLK